MAIYTLASGILFVLAGVGAFAYASRLESLPSEPISKASIYVFVGMGGIALGLLMGALGFFSIVFQGL